MRWTSLLGQRSAVGIKHARRTVSTAPVLPLVDNFARKHTYLRISLTEKCNLRCTYCMPEHGVQLTPREHLMTLDERKRAIDLFCNLGVNKIRFTGGEPTVSNQLLPLVAFARQRVDSVAITSNGIMLKDQLRNLVEAGLTSVNVSLDTLSESKFHRITRRDGLLLNKVLSSIYGAVALGLHVKINCVIMRGVNDDEIEKFVQLTRDTNVDCRFIELMPFDGNEWNPKQFVSYTEVVDRLREEQHIELIRERATDKHDTTKWYRISPTALGRVGFITSMSSHFCGGCNRLRITADGKLKVCLFGKEETDLKVGMRSGLDDDGLETLIRSTIKLKKAVLGGHATANELAADTNRPMILIGG